MTPARVFCVRVACARRARARSGLEVCARTSQNEQLVALGASISRRPARCSVRFQWRARNAATILSALRGRAWRAWQRKLAGTSTARTRTGDGPWITLVTRPRASRAPETLHHARGGGFRSALLGRAQANWVRGLPDVWQVAGTICGSEGTSATPWPARETHWHAPRQQLHHDLNLLHLGLRAAEARLLTLVLWPWGAGCVRRLRGLARLQHRRRMPPGARLA